MNFFTHTLSFLTLGLCTAFAYSACLSRRRDIKLEKESSEKKRLQKQMFEQQVQMEDIKEDLDEQYFREEFNYVLEQDWD